MTLHLDVDLLVHAEPDEADGTGPLVNVAGLSPVPVAPRASNIIPEGCI